MTENENERGWPEPRQDRERELAEGGEQSREQEAREQEALAEEEGASRQARSLLLLAPADHQIYGYGGEPEREPDAGAYDPEESVMIWRANLRERAGAAYSVRVMDDHLGEAPTLGEAIRIAGQACYQSTGGDESAPAHLGWWLGVEGTSLVQGLNLEAPGLILALAIAWREYQEEEIPVTVSFTASREFLRKLSDSALDTSEAPHSYAERFALALGEAVDR